MEVTLAVAADFASITNDNKLNIMGVFNEVNPAEFPTGLQQMFLVVSWEAGPAEFGDQKDVRIAFMDQDGMVKVNLDMGLPVPHPNRQGSRVTFNQILGLGGLPIENAGEHAFSILVTGEEKRRVPLYVHEPPQPPQGGQAE